MLIVTLRRMRCERECRESTKIENEMILDDFRPILLDNAPSAGPLQLVCVLEQTGEMPHEPFKEGYVIGRGAEPLDAHQLVRHLVLSPPRGEIVCAIQEGEAAVVTQEEPVALETGVQRNQLYIG